MSNEDTILFFSPGACSFGAIVALEWSNTPYKLCKVDKTMRQSDAYKRINPLQQVAALKVGNRVISENAAILNSIGARDLAKEIVFKQGTPEFDKMNQILSYLASNFHAGFYPFFAPQRYIGDEKQQQEVKQFAVQNIRQRYEHINQMLNGHETIFGGKPTVADAYMYGMLRWGASLFNFTKEFPNIAKFQAALEQDKAVQFALAAEKEDAAAKTTGKFEGFINLEDVKPPQSAKAA